MRAGSWLAIPIALCATAALAASAPKPPVRPPCPVGLVCFTPAEVAEIEKRVIVLERDLSIEKARSSRLGLCAGPGAGYSVSYDEGTVEASPSIGAYIVWGLRFGP